MSIPDLSQILRPGDSVVIGQATAEPPRLVEELIKAATVVPDVTAICGYCLTPVWETVEPGGLRVHTYAAHGAFRRLGQRGLLEILPSHYSALEPHFREGRLAADVVLLQVGPLDDEGYYSLGATCDYASAAAELAREVLVEVNPNMPRMQSSRRLSASLVTAAIETAEPLAGSPARAANAIEEQVARQVAPLIPSDSILQLGASALADAIAGQLTERRNMQVRTGLVGDWIVDLYESGALDRRPGSSIVGIALGTRRLYEFLNSVDTVRLAPLDEFTDPTGFGGRPFFSVNSAIEVDLTGAVNAEMVNGRYVGAVGGQVDFFRAARASAGGLAIVAMSSEGTRGETRIVKALQGPVTTSKSDVDVVVTEHGVADVRAMTLEARAAALAQVAAPKHRTNLTAAG